MPEHTEYETGSRVPKVASKEQMHEEFSQKAAENKKPPLGIGLTEKVDLERSETDKSDLQDSRTSNPEDDAKGQSESNHAGGRNDGVSSANPRVLSGNKDGDATFPLKKRSGSSD